jgi:hypothetical protein
MEQLDVTVPVAAVVEVTLQMVVRLAGILVVEQVREAVTVPDNPHL